MTQQRVIINKKVKVILKIIFSYFILFLTMGIGICYSQELSHINIKNISFGSNSLDLYATHKDISKLHPVLIFVHGGGWSAGDKSNWGNDQINFFRKNDILTVSVNYSLTDIKAAFPKRHPSHINDVCAGIKWVYENIEKYGGDKNNIFLIGHSAGSHLVALASTNQKFLNSVNLDHSIIKGTILLDAGPYLSMNDLNYCANNMKKDYVIRDIFNAWINAFGNDSLLWQEALPFHNIKSNVPPMLLLHSDVDYRVISNENFQKELMRNNQTVQNVIIKNLDHLAFLNLIGSSNDTYNLSNTILGFLKTYNPCTNDTIEFNIDGYKAGNIQWQFSSNKQIWTDIKGGNSVILKYKPMECGYLRAKVEYCNSIYFSDLKSTY